MNLCFMQKLFLFFLFVGLLACIGLGKICLAQEEIIYSQINLNNYNTYSTKCLFYTYSVPSQYVNTYRITKILTNNRSQTITSPSKLYTDIPNSEITYNTIPTYQTWITWTFTEPPIINDNTLIITLCRNSGTATARWYYGTTYTPANYSLYIYAEPIPPPQTDIIKKPIPKIINPLIIIWIISILSLLGIYSLNYDRT